MMIAEPTITVGPRTSPGPGTSSPSWVRTGPWTILDNTLNKHGRSSVLKTVGRRRGMQRSLISGVRGLCWPLSRSGAPGPSQRVAIPSTVQVKMPPTSDVAKIGSFAVPASTIEVTPAEGQPGDTVTLTAGNMPVYNEVDYVEIGGTTLRATPASTPTATATSPSKAC